ncbi:MAG: hypothetical protein N3D85_04535 [Candidatus Bathyarchaeota archaeon]|nr:hypothetical protein [Candidatus Bathyarchaeota archaeon]
MQTNAAKDQAEKIKTATRTLAQLNENKKECVSSLRSTIQDVAATKKLWREGNKSKLIQIGMALIVFPEPTPISEVIGAGFVAAGAVQKGIQNRALFMEDIGKTFKNTLKEVINTKYDLQI